MHAPKDRVESDTSTVYSISLYESTITTRDEPWFGELKLAPRSGVIGLPVTARDRILRCSPPVVGTTRAGPRFRKIQGQKPLKLELGKNGEVHPNRPMKNKRRTKGQWRAKRMAGTDTDPNQCGEELIWSLIFSPWAQSSAVFPGQIKDFWGFTQLHQSIF
ncbi:NADH-ubiquinone oxidoreductase chain 2 [Cucumis melo var. makuwa]|uniref:NADH-ubiquinone oxidoreductase chain 2 n=1 Tax=Cucumis melo var. makuwa TaxID=1194695 RepID=A0A5A7TKW3_CUCMM|nr:NADH-ubiquinone oxidoreductase chain 2 [Cucumis melo var. makuwa]